RARVSFPLPGGLDGLAREQPPRAIEDRGGRVASSVSKKTSYVVVGTDPGSKAARAAELGVPTLDEPAFAALLDRGPEEHEPDEWRVASARPGGVAPAAAVGPGPRARPGADRAYRAGGVPARRDGGGGDGQRRPQRGGRAGGARPPAHRDARARLAGRGGARRARRPARLLVAGKRALDHPDPRLRRPRAERARAIGFRGLAMGWGRQARGVRPPP